MSSVEVAWLRLIDALASRAPGTRAALRPPAPADPAVAGRLDIELNGEVSEWFGLHAGATPFFDGQLLPFNTVLSLPDAVEATRLSRSIWWRHEHVDRAAAERQPAGTTAHTWPASYVYIGQDGTGGGIFVDQRPGPLHGCVRFWDKVEADNGEQQGDWWPAGDQDRLPPQDGGGGDVRDQGHLCCEVGRASRRFRGCRLDARFGSDATS